MTTKSLVPPALTSSVDPSSAASPLVITTRAMSGEANTAPTNENSCAPLFAGAWRSAIRTPLASKNSTCVEPARSTSEKTTPKPLTRPAFVVPTTLKSTSTRLLPTAMNSFLGENALNWSANAGLMPAKAELSTRMPVPDVAYTAPRFELALKKPKGNVSTLVRAAGAPSQLISRRPLSAGAVLGAFRTPPRAVRKLVNPVATAAESPCARNVAYGGVLTVDEPTLLHAPAPKARMPRRGA